MTGAEQTAQAATADDDLALVLVGGGARAAYQVGFLRALVTRYPNLKLPIITGSSAGAINAVFLAAQVNPLPEALDTLADLWRGQGVTLGDDPHLRGWFAGTARPGTSRHLSAPSFLRTEPDAD